MSLEMTQSVLFFLCSHTSVSPMPSIPPLSENVPFEEVAAILDEAAMQARGGPPCSIPAAGYFLANALSAAGLHVVRTPGSSLQLTL